MMGAHLRTRRARRVSAQRSNAAPTAFAPVVISSRSLAIATCVISTIGCAIVVGRGFMISAQSKSSMPTIATSRGHDQILGDEPAHHADRHEIAQRHDSGRPVRPRHQAAGFLEGALR